MGGGRARRGNNMKGPRVVCVAAGGKVRIHEFNLFHNEHDALAIKQGEASRWVDELHLCEATHTFRGAPRAPANLRESDFLRPHSFDGGRFHPEYRWGFSRFAPFFRRKDMARKNEAMQRNHVHDVLDPEDADIVILADVDEIIDSRHADRIVDAARRHGIVSIRLRHTFFFLNLFSTRFHEAWPGSPPDYAYRVFAMTGAHFRAMRRTSDHLRRLGEWNRLAGEIHLLDGYCGFHHSWLGDAEAAMAKLKAYSHRTQEHDARLRDPASGEITLDRMGAAIAGKRSLFAGDELERRPLDDRMALPFVGANRDRFEHLVLEAA